MHLLVLLLAAAGDASTFGKSLALVGDLDGDRCSEIAVGSPSDGEGRRGKVFLYSGKSGALLRALDGEGENSGFGTDVAALGDVDGDDVPDLAIGSPFVRGKWTEGRVVIVSGKDGRRIRALEAESGEHFLGTDLVALGDLDGDGKEDLLVRARVGGGPTEHERFVAISAATGKRLFIVESPPGVLSVDLGRPIARLFDVDGDGIPDFAVEFDHVVHLRSGKDGKELKTIVPPREQDRPGFGYSICGVRGTEFRLAIGNPLQLLSKEGRAVTGGDPVGVAQSLATIGDLDGDGTDEIAVGRSDGRAGGVLVLSGKDLSTVRTIEDEPANGRIPLGYRVVSGRDVDGDGVPDIAVSRHWPTAAAAAQRSVVLFSGKDGKKLLELVSPAPKDAEQKQGR
jgi:hypothetical protein